ncbi:hypothetical protein C8Q75DRAFT_801485 [Abortiporus biennis]|nr:hypothetical protein C8Q75DRAFT_801485 [Abortiporus biennis]
MSDEPTHCYHGHWNMLPQELVDYIVDFLHSDRKSLRRTSLIARKWVHASQYHIFSPVSCSLSQNGKVVHSVDDSVSKFLLFFAKHPHLRRFVKDVLITDHLGGTVGLPSLTVLARHISAVTSALPSLHTLRLEHIIVTSPHFLALEELQYELLSEDPSSRPSLRLLELGICETDGEDIRDILCLFSSIDSLEVIATDIDPYLPAGATNPLAEYKFPSLKPNIRSYTACSQSLPRSGAFITSNNFWESIRRFEFTCELPSMFTSLWLPLIKPVTEWIEEISFREIVCDSSLRDDHRDEPEDVAHLLAISHIMAQCPKLKSLQFDYGPSLECQVSTQDGELITTLGERTDSTHLSKMRLIERQEQEIIWNGIIPFILAFPFKSEDGVNIPSNNIPRYPPPPSLETLIFDVHIVTWLKEPVTRICVDDMKVLGDPITQYLQDHFD